MPRATTKSDLIEAADAQFSGLWQQIDALSEEERSSVFLFEDRDKNLRDVLVHLYEWHRLLLNWVEANRNGIEKHFLPAPYNWKTYPKMNVEFWEKHQETPYSTAKEMLMESHAAVMRLIGMFSDDELFAKKYFRWTGTTSLGSYCVSATSSHYLWAQKKIGMHSKTYRQIHKK